MADTLELLSKTAVTKRPGWSKTLVERLLGDPDETTTHSTYKTLIGLYRQERILEAEKSQGYLDYQEKLAKRKKASIKAVKTKTDRLMDEITAMEIKVVAMPLKKAMTRAVHAYNNWNSEYDKHASLKDDLGFLRRITVNFIRHELSSYDETLYEIAGRTGSVEGRDQIWKKIFGEIAQAYPDLASECEAQLEKKLNPGWG